ncbi:FAD-binding oxidoreductase [Micromonospora krabiensis]|uniref:FAD/FMN-containing dehydrogenase n=1 Tax=Micromonospora krabiensis TaxID=307121 RepID=A0A1C3MXA6_9ACTN|nr:FAD-binding oxidoreductase [Micromonospora krabiensis]SBV24959.1 FAD/FMN-containing dehydrogenase [Micromonospora krabiensis]
MDHGQNSSQDSVAISMDAALRLATETVGPVLLPGEEGYDAECASYNLAVPQRPALVVGAARVADVQAAVRFAAEQGLPVAVLATGHSAHSSAGAVLVNTRRMDAVTIDVEARTARVEAGVRWQQVVDAAGKHGLAPLNGASPTVGVVGYTLGGGLSPIGRTFGFAADHVRRIELVTADGQLRVATATEEPELFWALRGGKGNFGVVTALEFNLFPVSHLYGGGLFFAGERAAEVFNAWGRWSADVPDEMNSSIALLQLPPVPEVPEPLRGGMVVHVRIAYVGSAEEGERLVAPLRAIAPVLIDSVTEMPYTAVASIHADPPFPIPIVDRSGLLREFTSELVDAIVAQAGPDAGSPLAIVELRHLGGALNRRPPSGNAMDLQGATFTCYAVGIGGPDQAEAIQAHLTRVFEAIQPWSTGRRFVNFLTAGDVTAEAVAEAYLPETYRRLAAIKGSYDPTNMFRTTHNIIPA